MNYELELKNLIIGEYDGESIANELGWVSDNEFCVWISYYQMKEFIDMVKDIFGYGVFDDGGFDGNIQSDCVCIDLCKMLDGFVSIEDVFPKDEYRH